MGGKYLVERRDESRNSSQHRSPVAKAAVSPPTQTIESKLCGDSERHAVPELGERESSDFHEADSEEENDEEELVEEHFVRRQAPSLSIGGAPQINLDEQADPELLDYAQLQSPSLSPHALEFSPSPIQAPSLYPSPGMTVTMVQMPMQVSTPPPHLAFPQTYLADPNIHDHPVQIFEAAPMKSTPVAIPGTLLGGPPGVVVSHSPGGGSTPSVSPHYSVSPASLTPLALPTTTTGREHVTRVLLLSNVASDISDMQLRNELFQWGPVRWLTLDLRREGLVTVHYFDLRHAMTALHDIQHQHLLQQQRVQQQLQASMQRFGVMSQTGGEVKESFREPKNVHVKGLIGGRPAWAQYVTAAGVSSLNNDNQGTLVVFNIDPEMPQSELRCLFEAYGAVKELRENPEKKQHKFVEFYDVRNAASAHKALDGSEVNGRKLKIEFSRPGGQAVRDRRLRQQLAQAQANQTALMTLSAGNHLGFLPSPGHTVVPIIGWPGDHTVGGTSPYSNSPVAASSAFVWASYNPLANSLVPPAAAQLSPPSINPYMPTGFLPAYPQQGGLQPVTYVPPMPHLNAGMGLVPIHSNMLSSAGPLPSAMDGQPYIASGRAICVPAGSHLAPPQLSPHGRAPDLSGPISPSGGILSHSTGEVRQWGSNISIPKLEVPSSFATIQPSGGKQAAMQRSPKGVSRSGLTPKSAPWEGMGTHYIIEDVSPDQTLNGERTTIMIKNIPNKYSQAMLLQMLDRHCASCNDARTDEREPFSAYDFVYLPIDFKNKCNLGYAFVNFTSVHATGMMYRQFHAKPWEAFNSRKVCQVTYARVQGRAALEDHFKNSRFACDTEEYLPLVFAPPRDGKTNTPPTVAAGHTGRPFGRRDGHFMSAGHRGGRARRSRSMSPTP